MSPDDVFPCLLEEGKTGADSQEPRETLGCPFQLPADMPPGYSRKVAGKAARPKTGELFQLPSNEKSPEPVWLQERYPYWIGSCVRPRDRKGLRSTPLYARYFGCNGLNPSSTQPSGGSCRTAYYWSTRRDRLDQCSSGFSLWAYPME